MPKKSESSVSYQERINDALADIQGIVSLERVDQVAQQHGVETSGLLKFLDVDWKAYTATNPEK